MTQAPFGPVDRDAVATEWVLRLQTPNLSEEELAAWMAWCEADPLNRRAFERMEEVWALAGGVQATLAHNSTVTNHGRILARVALAASVALVAAVGVATAVLERSPSSDVPKQPASASVQVGPEARLETERGHIVTARLDDGSQIDLGGRSALTVKYTEQSRLIIADQGEAFFRVQKNRVRPFVVQAGPVSVTAVGTAFVVTREEDSVAIAVTEGTVEVRATPAQPAANADAEPEVVRVTAGQRILFDQGKLARRAQSVDPTTVTSWREGRLDFRDEPLHLAVAQISRYTDREITVSDPAVADLRVSGTAYVDRIDAWLAGIETILPVRVDRMDDRHVFVRAAR